MPFQGVARTRVKSLFQLQKGLIVALNRLPVAKLIHQSAQRILHRDFGDFVEGVGLGQRADREVKHGQIQAQVPALLQVSGLISLALGYLLTSALLTRQHLLHRVSRRTLTDNKRQQRDY
jgi:hypothetical protein